MVEVRVLGPVELIDGPAVVRLAPVERTLLAALAARAGERVAVEVLEEALWRDDRPPSARKTLQGHVRRLRRAVGASAIVERSGGYRPVPDAVDIDAGRITGYVGIGMSSGSDVGSPFTGSRADPRSRDECG
jgi:DNA-binding SARP family transcriptional activator